MLDFTTNYFLLTTDCAIALCVMHMLALHKPRSMSAITIIVLR